MLSVLWLMCIAALIQSSWSDFVTNPDGQGYIYVPVLKGEDKSIICYSNASNTSWILRYGMYTMELLKNNTMTDIPITINDGSHPNSNSNLTITNFTANYDIQLTCIAGSNNATFIIGAPGKNIAMCQLMLSITF